MEQVPQDESLGAKEATGNELSSSSTEEKEKSIDPDTSVDPEPETADMKLEPAFHFDADEEDKAEEGKEAENEEESVKSSERRSLNSLPSCSSADNDPAVDTLGKAFFLMTVP